mmetsp:Transcript_70482/g.187715  ORF Transcript_70482/g.187715 Transcript_70482/m.187715 type:complete len:207 (+) Transcript_70482:643-1263(+)
MPELSAGSSGPPTIPLQVLYDPSAHSRKSASSRASRGASSVRVVDPDPSASRARHRPQTSPENPIFWQARKSSVRVTEPEPSRSRTDLHARVSSLYLDSNMVLNAVNSLDAARRCCAIRRICMASMSTHLVVLVSRLSFTTYDARCRSPTTVVFFRVARLRFAPGGRMKARSTSSRYPLLFRSRPAKKSSSTPSAGTGMESSWQPW